MKKIWNLRPSIPESKSLASQIKVHPFVVEILLRRGIKAPQEIFSFLNPSLESLESPFAFKDMTKAVEIIRQTVQSGGKILVYGDYDVDGVTGCAVLAPLIQKYGGHVEVHMPHRVTEGYGLNLETLKEKVKNNYALVITVDNGISGVEPIRFLKDRGIRTIIVDHHLPKDQLPEADAIISGALESGSGDPYLAACGLALKLAWALFGNFKDVEGALDLVTLGTIADLAPVLGDNRIILKHGLGRLARSQRPGLKALMAISRISPAFISYRDIAFSLGPRINASGRMGSPMDAYKLLTTSQMQEAQNLAQILDQGNMDRQRVELTAYEEAVGMVESDPAKDSLRAIVVSSPGWHEGVLGIVASRLVERYHRPSVVLGIKNGLAKGSGRSVPEISIFDAVKPCEEFLENFGGHAQACGLTIRSENIARLVHRLNENLTPKDGSKISPSELWIEAEVSAEDLGMSLLEDLEKMAPFGPGNERPLFVSRGLRVRGEVKKRGKDTLQCWMVSASGKSTCEVIGFRKYQRWMAGQKAEDRAGISSARSLYDIVYQPSLKNFNGITSVQFELEDWAVSSPSGS